MSESPGAHVCISPVGSGWHYCCGVSHHFWFLQSFCFLFYTTEPWEEGFDEGIPLRAECFEVSPSLHIVSCQKQLPWWGISKTYNSMSLRVICQWSVTRYIIHGLRGRYHDHNPGVVSQHKTDSRSFVAVVLFGFSLSLLVEFLFVCLSCGFHLFWCLRLCF